MSDIWRMVRDRYESTAERNSEAVCGSGWWCWDSEIEAQAELGGNQASEPIGKLFGNQKFLLIGVHQRGMVWFNHGEIRRIFLVILTASRKAFQNFVDVVAKFSSKLYFFIRASCFRTVQNFKCQQLNFSKGFPKIKATRNCLDRPFSFLVFIPSGNAIRGREIQSTTLMIFPSCTRSTDLRSVVIGYCELAMFWDGPGYWRHTVHDFWHGALVVHHTL